MNKIFIIILLTISNILNAQLQKIEESIYFDSDKYEIKEAENTKLLQLWKSISNDSILRIYIVGNTDNSADSLYNINLSKERCNVVQDFFATKNLNNEVFQINYFGENKPITENFSEEGKQKNRRVDIRLVYKKKGKKLLEKIVEQELVDTCLNIDTTIILTNGTELVFNRCEYLKIKDCLLIKSIRTTDELIENGTQLRTSENIPLVTCGMAGICFNPECGIKKECFDFPVKVRFPYPKDNEECLPCSRRTARVFNMDENGTWVATKNKKDKITIVTIEKQKYYQFEIDCPDCSMKNCDCFKFSDISKKKRTKVKLKIPFKYKLLEADIFIDYPTNVLHFEPDKNKKNSSKNVAISFTKCYTKCYNEGHRIQASAITPQGDTVLVKLQPLVNINHKILFSKCKMDSKDNQKIFGIFPAKKRAIYRKYKIRKRDFIEKSR